MAYKIVGADENSLFPPRVETRLGQKFATKTELSNIELTPGPKGDTGATGAKGDKGDTGAAGVSATNTGIKNSSTVIPANSGGTSTAAVTVPVNFFATVGAAKVAATATVTGLPTGVTVGANTPATASADGVLTLAFANGSTLGGADSGNITISIAANGITREEIFSWAKAKQGVQGVKGDTGAKGDKGDSYNLTPDPNDPGFFI